MPTDPVVILTREPADNAPLRQLLESAGVSVVEFPCLGVEWIPPERWQWPEGSSIQDFLVIAFTSRHGVGAFLPILRERAADKLLAVVGPGTQRALGEWLARDADIVADPPTGARLATELADHLEMVYPDRPPWQQRVLWVRGDRSTGRFREVLEDRGLEVSELVVYRHREIEPGTVTASPPAVLVFASPSAAMRFFHGHGAEWTAVPCVAIGPTTAASLDALGCLRVIRAPAPDVEALAGCIQNCLQELKQHGT